MRSPTRPRLRYVLRAALAAVVVLLLPAPSALAEWKTNYDQGRKLLSEEDYRNAENALIEALREAEAFGDSDDRYISTLESLAEVYRKTRQWAAAAPLYVQALAGYKKAGKDKSPAAGFAQNKLGFVYYYMKDYDKAQEAFEGALDVMHSRYKTDASMIAQIVNNLGELYRRRSDWGKAERLFKQAVEDKETELGPEHPSLVSSLNDLALTYFNMQRYDQAVPVLERALALAKKTEPKGGDNYATVLHNMGLIASAQSKLEVALDYFKQAAAMREEVLGPKHPFLATTLQAEANTLTQLDRPKEAVPLFERALAIRELEFGKRSPEVRKILESYVFTLRAVGDTAKLAEVEARINEIKGGK